MNNEANKTIQVFARYSVECASIKYHDNRFSRSSNIKALASTV
jgi:hypothetical protein